MKIKKWYLLKISLVLAGVFAAVVVYAVLSDLVNKYRDGIVNETDITMTVVCSVIFTAAVIFCITSLYLLQVFYPDKRIPKKVNALFITGYVFFCIAAVFITFISVYTLDKILTAPYPPKLLTQTIVCVLMIAGLLCTVYVLFAAMIMRNSIKKNARQREIFEINSLGNEITVQGYSS